MFQVFNKILLIKNIHKFNYYWTVDFAFVTVVNWMLKQLVNVGQFYRITPFNLEALSYEFSDQFFSLSAGFPNVIRAFRNPMNQIFKSFAVQFSAEILLFSLDSNFFLLLSQFIKFVLSLGNYLSQILLLNLNFANFGCIAINPSVKRLELVFHLFHSSIKTGDSF